MRNSTRRHGAAALVLALLAGFGLAGCHQDMWDQPYHRPLERSDFFPDRRASRPAPEGRVPYDGARRRWADPVYAELSGSERVPSVLDDAFYTGSANGEPVGDNYFPVTRVLLERGKQRYAITCLPCHGPLGDGHGFITTRGFPNPPTFHQQRLREVEDGHLFDVMTNGFGRMYSFASLLLPEDRWAVAAYIRALQLSQDLDPGLLPEDERQAVRAALEAQTGPARAANEHDEGGAGHGAHE